MTNAWLGWRCFVVKDQGKGETLSMKEEPCLLNTLTWKIDKFSELTDENGYNSKAFSCGGCKCCRAIAPVDDHNYIEDGPEFFRKLLFCPEEVQENEIPKSISLNLEISENDNTLPPGWEINAIEVNSSSVQHPQAGVGKIFYRWPISIVQPMDIWLKIL
ncbi:hypothetical protein COLO4_32332 [Corchorus olitorius]|uniref:Uncharacterized protein n=1 Tax=Corchorus olitorius TaxID=93759 RepID=A0A1R3GZN2_9ROSI|nr:hypothetical protein COLO4_32332 [Corchorus olitorius]